MSTDLITREQVENVLVHGGDIGVADPEAVQADMVQRILSASSLADAFANFKATSCRDVEGILIHVNGIAWMRSAFKDGPAVYALLTCQVAETDEQIVVSMGGRSLMASFLWNDLHGGWPLTGVFRKQQSGSNAERSFWTFVLPDIPTDANGKARRGK